MITASDATTPTWDTRLQKIALLIGRLGLAYLFFTQLFWKLPPTFGCVNNNALPQPAAENYWTGNGSAGLCFWLGIESIYQSAPRDVLVADMRPAGLPRIGLPITPLAQMNGAIVDHVIVPNLGFFGWLIWLAELWVFVSLLLGLFTRFGGLVALGVALQLYVGLAGIPRPYEWEWSYGAIALLSLLMFGLAPGRVWGLDARLRPRLAGSRNLFGRLLWWLT
jgi:uncharacterized membrane protein YphA (DoxX/SURF4 family)